MNPSILEHLASRICHDLISPIGAVQNGVEFMMEMDGEADDEAISLISHSVKTAAARLQAFRMAYGAGGRDPNLKPEDVHKTFMMLLSSDKKIALTWNPYDDIGHDRAPEGFCKILMGSLMLAQECLPKGGQIGLSADADKSVQISAEGPGATPRANAKEALEQALPIEDLDPRLVHPYALSILAGQYGYKVEFHENEPDRVIIRLSA